MNAEDEPKIIDVEASDRVPLEQILEESFEGWYLRHSKRILHETGKVRMAQMGGKAAGVSMLKVLGKGTGYVYYIAVAKAYRRRGVGGALLDDAMAYFSAIGTGVVYASVENEGAEKLFASRGFKRTDFAEVSKKYGLLRAISMYRGMVSVPGEALLQAEVTVSRDGPIPSFRV
jgi:ribosomal protein S18 acetylase RimI-like enzyme